ISGQFLVGATAATFIFDNLNGTISGWNGGTAATVQATTAGAIYTGLASGSSAGSNFLYAAHSAPGGQIRVFNSSWTDVTGTAFAGKFPDPTLPAGFVPFNVQNINGSLYVTYAMLGPGGVPMPGGFVDKYDTSGNLVSRIATQGSLFAPWGVVIAPGG